MKVEEKKNKTHSLPKLFILLLLIFTLKNVIHLFCPKVFETTVVDNILFTIFSMGFIFFIYRPHSFLNSKIQSEEELLCEERELIKATEQLKSIFDTLDSVIWSVDIKNRKVTLISKACEKIYGYSQEDFLNDIGIFEERIHPEDQEKISNEVRNFMNEGTPFQIEYRIIHANGEIKWILDHTIPVKNENGEITRFDGVIVDITEKKVMEAEMQSELELAQSIQHGVLTPSHHDHNISIEAKYLPSQHLGGDMYVWYPINEHSYGVFLMDVMGHGIASSLVSMSIRPLLRTLITKVKDPATVLLELNKHMNVLFKQNTSIPTHYFTCIHMVIDTKEKEIEFTNAGHPPAIIIDGKGNVIELESNTVPIGLLSEITPFKQTISYEENFWAILYTDGLIDVTGKRMNQMVSDLKLIMSQNKNIPIDELICKLKHDEVGNLSLAEDDICVISIQTY